MENNNKHRNCEFPTYTEGSVDDISKCNYNQLMKSLENINCDMKIKSLYNDKFDIMIKLDKDSLLRQYIPGEDNEFAILRLDSSNNIFKVIKVTNRS